MALELVEGKIGDKVNENINKPNDELILLENRKAKKIETNKNIKKKLKKYILDIIAILNLIIGRFLYIKSLKGCSKSEFDCLHDLQLIKEGIKNCLNSTFYFIFTLFLIHMKICSINI